MKQQVYLPPVDQEMRRGRLNQPPLTRQEMLEQARATMPLSPSAEAEYQRNKNASSNSPALSSEERKRLFEQCDSQTGEPKRLVAERQILSQRTRSKYPQLLPVESHSSTKTSAS